MNKYTIAQIETLTGIKAHTLRKWEERYSFIQPVRTDTNIRYYSNSELKKLLNISVLVRNGYRISKIDQMSDIQIHEAITSKLLNKYTGNKINALIIAMLEMDEDEFVTILESEILKKGILSASTELIYPFLDQVGVLWGISKIVPAQEHFFSNIIKRKMCVAIESLPKPPPDAPKILMFLVEDEHHEFGLLLAYYIAKKLGWRVIYLGENVPSDNIEQVLKLVQVDAMFCMFISPVEGGLKDRMDVIQSKTNLPLLISGNPQVLEPISDDSRAIILTNPNEFIEYLQKYRNERDSKGE